VAIPSNLVLSAADMVPGTDVVAAATLTVIAVVPDALIAPEPATV